MGTQGSLITGLEPFAHVALGRALAPLRDEGVLILGSGMSFHNMRGFGGAPAKDAIAFDKWLQNTCVVDGAVGVGDRRIEALSKWERAPGACFCHPREEHLMPLLVLAGAAGDDGGVMDFHGTVMGIPVSGFRFGGPHVLRAARV